MRVMALDAPTFGKRTPVNGLQRVTPSHAESSHSAVLGISIFGPFKNYVNSLAPQLSFRLAQSFLHVPTPPSCPTYSNRQLRLDAPQPIMDLLASSDTPLPAWQNAT